jgi:hypothetical protein
MVAYLCPMCGDKVPEDLTGFNSHRCWVAEKSSMQERLPPLRDRFSEDAK